MSDLPHGWCEARLDELLAPEPSAITDGPFGSNLKTEHYTEFGPRVIRLQNVGDGIFYDAEAHISEEHFNTLRKHEARVGDVIVAALGEDLPRACMVPASLGPAIVKADCIRVRLSPEINPHFVMAMLNSPAVRRNARAQISGVGRPRLNLTKIRSVRIPVPPEEEQIRIVTAIEQHFSHLDAAEDSLMRVKQRLVVLGEVLFRQALIEGPRRKLGEVVRTTSGGTPKRSHSEFFGGSISWIKSGELGDGVVLATEESITEIALRKSSAKLVPEGTLLIAMYGATIGKLGRVGVISAATNQAVAALFPNEELNGDYLWNVLRALREDLVRLGQGGAQPNISQSILREIEIPVPSLTEQAQINAAIERGVSVWRQLTRQVESAIQRSMLLRRSILAAAFAGVLVPQDPSEESASVLVERISASRNRNANRSTPAVAVS